MNNKNGVLYKKYLWWKFEGRYIISDFIKGIKNIIKWFPTIWKDRDYDHSYIFIILKNKLNNQADYLEKNNHFENSLRQAQIIKTCVRLIDRINDDYYYMEYTDYHVSSHDWLDYNEGEYFNKGYKEMKTTLLSENFDEYFFKYKLVYKKISNQFPLENRMGLAIKIAHENQKRCKKLLFSILENNIENWWD
jgi:hypothetical protein